jgi:hypothetical protein
MSWVSPEKQKEWSRNHPEKVKAFHRRYWEKHKEQYLEHTRRYRAENPDHFNELARRYKESHRMASRRYRKIHSEKVKDRARKYMSAHPEKLIFHNTITAMMNLYGERKTCRSHRYIGCSPGFLRNHLESLFKPGMTWENYGRKGWHVDHIVPLSWFSFKEDPSLLFVASHWTNLRPLWAIENIRKGNRHAA